MPKFSTHHNTSMVCFQESKQMLWMIFQKPNPLALQALRIKTSNNATKYSHKATCYDMFPYKSESHFDSLQPNYLACQNPVIIIMQSLVSSQESKQML